MKKKPLSILVLLCLGLKFILAQDCEVNIIANDTVICGGESTILTATPGFEHYFWDNGQIGQSTEIEGVDFPYDGFFNKRRLYAIDEYGCIAYAEFEVEVAEIHPNNGSLQGSVRIGDSLLLDACWYYYLDIPEKLTYLWRLNGDTIGIESTICIDTVGYRTDTFLLSVEVKSDCDSIVYTHQEFISDNPSYPVYRRDTFCTNYFPISPSISKPGEYLFMAGFDFAKYNYFNYVEEGGNEEIVYDTITMCKRPTKYMERNFYQPGNYQFHYSDDNGCLNRFYLEVLPNDDMAYSITEIDVCTDPPYEYNGTTYNKRGVNWRHNTGEDGCDSLSFVIFNQVTTPVAITHIDTTICEGDTLIVDGQAIVQEGVYPFYHSFAYGCDSIVNWNVAIIPLTYINTDLTICYGDTAHLYGAQFYESGNHQLILPAGVEACDTIVDLSIEMAPPIEYIDLFIIGADGFSLGAIFLNINGGTPPYEFLWSNGSDVQNLVSVNAGHYDMTVTDAIGCQKTFNFEIPLVTASSEWDDIGSEITVIPNPFKAKVTFSMISQTEKARQLKLFNIRGELVWQTYWANQIESFDLSELPAGIYLYQVYDTENNMAGQGKLMKH